MNKTALMKRLAVTLLLSVSTIFSFAQDKVKRPPLVVGVVIDQMRWDYLYRYYSQYGSGGFKRLLKEGFSCENTMINYLPAYTGPGHACVYTGSVPALHGITGNTWIENATGRNCYCVGDATVCLASEESKSPSMSPSTLLTTTVTDELRLATNFKSKVYGVALKDRGSILPAGHLANAAYWYDDRTASFATSTYYKNQNPAWLKAFNQRHVPDSLLSGGWKLLRDETAYDQSTADAVTYERSYPKEKIPAFPHTFKNLNDNERRSLIKSVPAGNTYTLMMAEACIAGERLGMGNETDFLAVSLSATDYVGHQFGPNSMEAEDTYLRLDRDLASFLKYLDGMVGDGNYLLFLTADHGAAHNAKYLSDLKVPSGFSDFNDAAKLNDHLQKLFHKDSLVAAFDNYQVFLNNNKIKSGKLNKDKIKEAIMQWLGDQTEIAFVVDMEHMDRTPLPEPIRTMAINGYNKKRSGDILVILDAGWYTNELGRQGTTHGTWNPYDTHIPLLWYGWHVQPGVTHNVVHMTDIAATVAAMLHIQMPNGCIGKPITEIVDVSR